MKQAIDTATLELPHMGEVITPDNSTAIKHTIRYRFYIQTGDDNGDREYVEWRNLTRKQARDMYAYTDAHQPSNVTGYGWEEQK